MNPARIIDGALSVYPYTLRMLRAERPQTSWPADWSLIDLASVGCVAVQAVEPTALQPGEQAQEGTPELVDGHWQQTWVVVPAPAPEVPEQVPAHHLRRALRAFGMLPAVNAYIASLPEDAPMREDWEYAPFFRRDAVGIGEAAQGLGLSSAQVDELFIAAGNVVT